MAHTPIQDRVDNAVRAIKAILSGRTPGFTLVEDLEFVERYVGAQRPLAEYAPRTRRRYLAAARKADAGARQTKAAEKTARVSRAKHRTGLTPSQLTQLNRWRNEINASGVDIREYLDDSTIKDMVTMYGFKYLKAVLTHQIESIREWTKGNREPGRTRWMSRGELEAKAREDIQFKFAAVVYHAKGTDPYYYYHGSLK